MKTNYISSILKGVDSDTLIKNLSKYISMYDNSNDEILDLITGEHPFIDEEYIESHRLEIINKMNKEAAKYSSSPKRIFMYEVNVSTKSLNQAEVIFHHVESVNYKAKDDDYNNSIVNASNIIRSAIEKVKSNPLYTLSEIENKACKFLKDERANVSQIADGTIRGLRILYDMRRVDL